MKILFISDSVKMNSGYSIVTKNLARGLKRLGYNVSTIGLQTAYCTEYFDDGDGGNIEVLPIVTDKTDDIGQLMVHIQNVSPDIVLYIGNLGDYDNEVPNIAKVFPGTWLYVPINGKSIPLSVINDLNKVIQKGGKVIAMCQYGYNEMKRAGVDVSGMIYHGYDDAVFKKIDVKSITGNETISILKWNKEQKRWIQYNIDISRMAEIFGYRKNFVFLHIGQNVSIRKRQERLLTAYAIMIRDNKQLMDRTRMLMHCLPISSRGLNLIEVVMKLGIQENISFSYGNYLAADCDEKIINQLYNIADVQVTATSSEGFMIPILEGFATGLPMIGTNCTSLIELITDEQFESNNRGLLANVESWYMEPSGRYKPLVSEQDLADKMKKLYIDEKLREKVGNNGMKWVKQWTWEKVVQQWGDMIDKQ